MVDDDNDEPGEFLEIDGKLVPDPATALKRRIQAALLQLDEDEGGELDATVAGLLIFLSFAAQKLAILKGESDGLAIMHGAGRDGNAADAADALVSVWMLTNELERYGKA